MFEVADVQDRFTSIASKRSESSGDADPRVPARTTPSKASAAGSDDELMKRPVAPADSNDAAASPRGEILIVDDDKTLAGALQRLIKQAGYSSRVYHSAADAIAHAKREAPAAALIDVHLGDLSGLVLAKELRELVGDHMPIIMLSGDTSMETLNSLSHVGATYFFSKPMNPATLVEQLREWVR